MRLKAILLECDCLSIRYLKHRYGGKCCYCRRFITISYEPRSKKDPHRTTLEHLRRRADGGNSRDNLIVACKACSDSRGAADWLTCAI
jgi:5-methylcytosine-specific restriction endonuclease McrA